MKHLSFSAQYRQPADPMRQYLAPKVVQEKKGECEPGNVGASMHLLRAGRMWPASFQVENAPQDVHEELVSGLQEILDDTTMRFKRLDIVRFRYLSTGVAAPSKLLRPRAWVNYALVQTSDGTFFFPLTNVCPDHTEGALSITEIECRRGSVDYPAWLIFKEYIFVSSAKVFDFDELEPRGTFSLPFFRRIAAAIAEFSAKRRLTQIEQV